MAVRWAFDRYPSGVVAAQMIRLESVYRHKRSIKVLYDLLAERPSYANISHRKMPTVEDHTAFVNSDPYRAWYLIITDTETVGSIYLTKQNEIGIFIFQSQQGKGYGTAAIAALRERWHGRMLANVSPLNVASQEFFKKAGWRLIQHTFEIY